MRGPENLPSALPKGAWRWWGAILVGAVGILLTDLALRYTELMTGRYISSGVPPVAAFALLLLLVALRPLLGRWLPPLAPRRGEMLLAYAMMTIGVSLGGAYIVRAFLPHLVSLQYWSRQDPSLKGFDRFLPPWYAPRDAEAIRLYFEGSHSPQVPWEVWARPLLWWSTFFLALFVATFCLVWLWHRRWIHHERLTFPLLSLPLILSAPEVGERGGGWFRRPSFWAGFALAALFNALNIAHALIPAVPAPGFSRSLSGLFPARPWTPLNSIVLFFMLESIGFGYLMPLEVLFSTWFFYLFLRFFAVAGVARGYEMPGFPFVHEQCAGAYLAIALFLVWSHRRRLGDLLRPWRWRAQGVEEGWAVGGLAVSMAYVLGWCHVAGFSLTVAVPFFAVLGAFTLVYARLRAETGAPNQFIYPYGLPKGLVVNAFSVPGVLDIGGVRTMVVFSSLAWLSRHHYTEAMAAYQLDALKLAEAGHIPRWAVVAGLTVAFLVGWAGALWAHLSAYYEIGSNLSGGAYGEYRAKVALQEYQWMAQQITLQPPRDTVRLGFTLWGFFFVALLAALRLRFPGDPFHPLGFVLATAYGDTCPLFFPTLVAWLAKSLILKVGGLKLYRQGIPFFVGLIVGHFFCGGVFWPILSVALGPQTSQVYHLHFGG